MLREFAGAAISKVASTMPNTNGVLPCVIAISLCPNPPPLRATGPAHSMPARA